MSWQKCPICNGTGINPHGGTFNTAVPVCSLCQGQKIISEITGFPPGGLPIKQDKFCDIARFVMKHRLKNPQITLEEIEKLWKSSN